MTIHVCAERKEAGRGRLQWHCLSLRWWAERRQRHLLFVGWSVGCVVGSILPGLPGLYTHWKRTLYEQTPPYTWPPFSGKPTNSYDYSIIPSIPSASCLKGRQTLLLQAKPIACAFSYVCNRETGRHDLFQAGCWRKEGRRKDHAVPETYFGKAKATSDCV